MEPKKRYKIVYDRDNCIGAGACVIAYEERWVMDAADDKANLIGGKQEDGSWILEFTEEELAKFMDSAQVCPVNVIHIFEVETGKKLI